MKNKAIDALWTIGEFLLVLFLLPLFIISIALDKSGILPVKKVR